MYVDSNSFKSFSNAYVTMNPTYCLERRSNLKKYFFICYKLPLVSCRMFYTRFGNNKTKLVQNFICWHTIIQPHTTEYALNPTKPKSPTMVRRTNNSFINYAVLPFISSQWQCCGVTQVNALLLFCDVSNYPKLRRHLPNLLSPPGGLRAHPRSRRRAVGLIGPLVDWVWMIFVREKNSSRIPGFVQNVFKELFWLCCVLWVKPG